MLKVLRRDAAGFDVVEPGEGWTLPEDAIWIELVEPSREEELAVERAVGLELPTREDMAEIEPSSRLYQDNGATVMTAAVLTHSATDTPVLAPVTFVLTGQRLVTIRYVEPTAFKAFTAQVERQPGLLPSGGDIFIGLIEAVVDRLADILEGVADDV